MKGVTMTVNSRCFWCSIVLLLMMAGAEHQAVHDKGDARHIAAVFQNGEQEKEHEELGNKGQYRSHACNDAVHQDA
jgi:hypothetical protein